MFIRCVPSVENSRAENKSTHPAKLHNTWVNVPERKAPKRQDLHSSTTKQ